MVLPHLPPDDLPSPTLALEDRFLRHQLDLSLTQRFQQQCDPNILQLLATCEWSISTAANVATLIIVCPDRATNWQVLERVVELGNEMAKFSQDAKLRIYSSPKMGDRVEIRIDELSIYQEPS
ncbi:MAG: hypothetical protein J7647_33070 [Cyanobacteria bacterium SBLK]|nr:hypothetical protein [Cyanobacteria bacterium SBLK]